MATSDQLSKDWLDAFLNIKDIAPYNQDDFPCRQLVLVQIRDLLYFFLAKGKQISKDVKLYTMIDKATGVKEPEKVRMHVIRLAGNIAAHSWTAVKKDDPEICKTCFREVWVAVKGLSGFEEFLRDYVVNTLQVDPPKKSVADFLDAVAKQNALPK